MITDDGVDRGDDDRSGVGLAEALGLDDTPVGGAESVAAVDATLPSGAEPPERLSSVLVAVGGGAHSGATVDVARGIGDATDAWIELFHVVEASEPAAVGESYLDAAADRLGPCEEVDRWLVTDADHDSPAAAIVEQSAYYDAVILGASTTGTVGELVFGSTTKSVLEDAVSPVVVVEADGDTSLLDD